MARPTLLAPWVVQDDGTVDILVYEGRTFRAAITHAGLTDSTGYKARMALKADYDATTALASADSVDGDITFAAAVAPATGTVITVTITDEDMAAVTVARGVYDLVLESPGGQEDTILTGKFYTRQLVTP